MKKWKKFLTVFVAFGLISIGTLSWYAWRYSMEPIAGFEVNSDTLKTHVLIATQGSEFKNAVVKDVIDDMTSEPFYFKVIDVSLLGTISEDDWDAIVIIHTWEYSSPPASVEDFVGRVKRRERVMVVTTSGSGSKLEGVDGISSASKTSEQESVAQAIVTWIKSNQN
ncbi:MAG: hypothetical protein C0490_02565 [Marivirga sp.]|nr:hypothetical protein [Marivirga sp.]